MTALSIVATNATKGESEQSSLKLCLGLLLAVMAKFSVFDLNKIKQNFSLLFNWLLSSRTQNTKKT